jgi:lipopolysaccharide export system permease protein
MLVAFAFLGEARTTRQGRAVAIQLAILLVGAIRIGAYAAWTASVRSSFAVVLLYLLPLVTIAISASMIAFGARARVVMDRLTEPLAAPFLALSARFRRS